MAGLEFAICSCGRGQSELGPSVCLPHVDTRAHTHTQSHPLSRWLSCVVYFTERLTHTGTVHLAVQSAMSRGHVSGLLFRRVCGFREKKKGGGGGGVGGGDDGGGGGGGAHIDSYPLAARQEAAFIILPLK